MKVAHMRISPEFLRFLLPLPESASILGSREAHGEIVVVIEDKSFRETIEGESIPTVSPTFRKHIMADELEFVDWGPK